ncbi:MAG: magnesium transporter, partial [Duncaniella sp.]|nr:magnesium transporter [Duncaniella sp.]
MKEFTPEYLAHLHKIIEDRADEAARDELSDLHPADIAELYRDLDIDEAEYLFLLLDEEMQADVLMELDEDERSHLLAGMDAEDIAKQIEHHDTDDAV